MPANTRYGTRSRKPNRGYPGVTRRGAPEATTTASPPCPNTEVCGSVRICGAPPPEGGSNEGIADGIRSPRGVSPPPSSLAVHNGP